MQIRVKNLQLSWSDYELKVKSWSLQTGEHSLIEGPSGCGKTTFLHALAGLIPLTKGEIYWSESALHKLSFAELAELRRQKLGLIFQRIHLVPHLTLLENVLLGGPDENLARELCESLSLSPRLQHLPQKLSLGETQRAAVARALMNKPELILADEPTSGLDDDNARRVLDLLLERGRNASLIMVSHDSRTRSYFKKIQAWKELQNS